MRITPEYRALLLNMREQRPNWGPGAGKKHLHKILDVIQTYKAKTVLDYGCGNGAMVQALIELGIDARGYDPGVPTIDALPKPADLLISTDVLEHVEPECLNDVLRHMVELTQRVAYIHISTVAARAILPDGRNAHLIIQPAKWWRARLLKWYGTVMPQQKPKGATCVCLPR